MVRDGVRVLTRAVVRSCYFCDQIQCECGARSDPAIYDTHFGLSVYVSHLLEYRHPKIPAGSEGEPMYFERVLGYAVERSLDPVGAVGPSKGSVVAEPEAPKPNRYGLVMVDGAVTGAFRVFHAPSCICYFAVTHAPKSAYQNGGVSAARSATSLVRTLFLRRPCIVPV